MALSDKAIRAAKPGEKPIKLFDERGLFLLVTPAGGKWWRLRYRYLGKEKLISLGTYPDTTLARARENRDQARTLLADGIDPSEARRSADRSKKLSAANSFAAVAREWHGKQEHTWAKKHAEDVLRRLEANIFPSIGPRPIGEIEAPELLSTVRKIEARGAYDLAHRVMAVCGQVFRYGVATGRCKRDPTGDLRGALTPHKAKHQAAVRPEELPELLHKIDAYDGDPLTRLALQLMAATFVRTNELIGALWDEFDLDAAVWVIPAGRMKMKTEHLVPLSKQAIAILKTLKEAGRGSRFVFPGRNRDKPISNNTMLFALYRMGYRGRMTGHGFRAVASTVLNEAGFNPDAIERQLAHCERDEVRGAYNRAEYLPERRKLMKWWADYLDSVKAGAEVVPFKRVA